MNMFIQFNEQQSLRGSGQTQRPPNLTFHRPVGFLASFYRVKLVVARAGLRVVMIYFLKQNSNLLHFGN